MEAKIKAWAKGGYYGNGIYEVWITDDSGKRQDAKIIPEEAAHE